MTFLMIPEAISAVRSKVNGKSTLLVSNHSENPSLTLLRKPLNYRRGGHSFFSRVFE